METLIDFLGAPADMHGVLAHLQSAGGHTACVDSLAGSEDHLGIDEGIDGFGRATHIGDFTHTLHAVGDELTGIVAVELVLRGTGQRDIALLLPRLLALEEGGFGELLGIGGADVVAAGTQLQQVVDLLTADAGRIIDVAIGTADGDDLGAELCGLGGSAPGDIAEAADGHGLALDVLAVGGEHLVDEVEAAEAGSLRAHERAAIFEALAGEHAAPVARELLVLSEEVANLAGTDADVAGRHVNLRTDVAVELAHEGLAEAHHLGIALAADAEVAAAFAAAHGQRSEGVLEGLLEA